MSSIPKEYTFFSSYAKNSNETNTNQNIKYSKELKYLEEELKYWITENGIEPTLTKELKIKKIIEEIKIIKDKNENT